MCRAALGRVECQSAGRLPSGASMQVIKPACPENRPVMVLFAGLGWLGGGALDKVAGDPFNTEFARRLAQSAQITVVLVSPRGRHVSTFLGEPIAAVLFLLTFWAWWGPFFVACAVAAFGWVSYSELLAHVVLLPLGFGYTAQPLIHVILVRGLMAARWPKWKPVTAKESAEAVWWAADLAKRLRADNELILAGYSSGGGLAAQLLGGDVDLPPLRGTLMLSALLNAAPQAEGPGAGPLAAVTRFCFRHVWGPEEACKDASPSHRLPLKATKFKKVALVTCNDLPALPAFGEALFGAGAFTRRLQAAGFEPRIFFQASTSPFGHWSVIQDIASYIQEPLAFLGVKTPT